MSNATIISLAVGAVGAICSMLSLVGNMIAVVIMLYVRSEVKPLTVKIEHQEKHIGNLWREIGEICERTGNNAQQIERIKGQYEGGHEAAASQVRQIARIRGRSK